MKKLLLRITVISLAALALLLAWGVYSARPPTDRQLLQQFASHQAEMEQLREMFVADSRLKRVTKTFAQDDHFERVNLPDDRFAQYKHLLSAAGLLGLNRTDDCIYFSAFRWGFAGSGTAKGFAYCTAAPKSVLSSLDGKSTERRSQHYFKPIRDGWYLLFVS
jgi:hypothetical protein